MTIETGTRGFGSPLAIREHGVLTWELTDPLVWTGETQTFTVPVGFVTDFATSPRFLHWLWLPYGAYTRAAVLHDYLLTELVAWDRTHPLHGRETYNHSEPPANSYDADAIFRVAMRDLGVGWPKRWMGWTAVRWGALLNPRRAYGRDFAKDAPKVLGMSLLVVVGSLGTIPAAALLVLVALGVVRITTALTGGRPSVRRTARRGRPAGSRLKENDHG